MWRFRSVQPFWPRPPAGRSLPATITYSRPSSSVLTSVSRCRRNTWPLFPTGPQDQRGLRRGAPSLRKNSVIPPVECMPVTPIRLRRQSGEAPNSFYAPHPIGHPARRGRHPESLVDAAEIVIHGVKRDGRRVVLRLLAEGGCQASEPADIPRPSSFSRSADLPLRGKPQPRHAKQ